MEDKGKSKAISRINKTTPGRGAIDIRDYVGETERYHVWAWDGYGSEWERVYICIPKDGDEKMETVINLAGPTAAQERFGVWDEVIKMLHERVDALEAMGVTD